MEKSICEKGQHDMRLHVSVGRAIMKCQKCGGSMEVREAIKPLVDSVNKIVQAFSAAAIEIGRKMKPFLDEMEKYRIEEDDMEEFSSPKTEGLLRDKDGEPILLSPDCLEYEGVLDYTPAKRGTLRFILNGKTIFCDDGQHHLTDNDKLKCSHICYDCGNIRFVLHPDHGYEGELDVSYTYEVER